MNFYRAFVGLILIPLYHLPRILFQLLLVSYAAVFNNRPTLTADPAEHLARAQKILNTGRLSELLYVALELRFALERMAQRDLRFAKLASNRVLDENDPVKKISNLNRLAPATQFHHEIFMVNKETGERVRWGEYKPLNKKRVSEIEGRLGDLLHAKDGLLLGIPDDPWYKETQSFLQESSNYLQGVLKDNLFFFGHAGLDHFEMVRIEGDDV